MVRKFRTMTLRDLFIGIGCVLGYLTIAIGVIMTVLIVTEAI